MVLQQNQTKRKTTERCNHANDASSFWKHYYLEPYLEANHSFIQHLIQQAEHPMTY